MINKEFLKKEVYNNEKKKLYFKSFFFDIVVILVIIISLSSVAHNQREDELIQKLRTLKEHSDSLEYVISNSLVEIKNKENRIIRTALNISEDTTYADIDFNNIFGYVEKQSKILDKLDSRIETKLDSINSVPVGSPITIADLSRISDGFGWRKHPILKRWIFHEGTDFSAPIGTPVMTTSDGVVERVVKSRRGYGNRIVINHGYGYKTVYAHLKSFNVKKGDIVKRGDVIGFVGSTGLSTGPHLHYEVLINNRPVDPKQYYYYGGVYYANK